METHVQLLASIYLYVLFSPKFVEKLQMYVQYV